MTSVSIRRVHCTGDDGRVDAWHRTARDFALVSLLTSLTVHDVRAQPDRLNLYSTAAAPTIALDPNGFLKNPRWYRNGAQVDLPNIEAQCRFRVATGHLDRRSLVVTTPNCLSENERRIVTLDEASPTLGLGAVCVTGGKTGNVRGHVNWFPVTVTGQIHWDSFAGGIQDHDVNFDLIPQTDHALTTGNSVLPALGGRRAYHIESYFEETFDRIGATGGEFWPEVKADITDPAAARDLIDDRFAIVTGLYGLDAVHGFQAELHPAFMMSILLDASRAGDRAHEQWAVMVRNMGSEGDCAGGTHALATADTTLHTQRLIIDLGVAPAAAGQPGALPRVTLGPNWVSDLGFRPTARIATDGHDGRKHLYLDFVHPRPILGELDFLFLGQVSIDWSNVSASAWQERLDAWRPRDSSAPPKLGTIHYKSAPERLRASAELVEKTKYRKGVPGETVLRHDRRDLHHFTADVELSVGELPTPVVSAQVRSSASWPLAEAVRFGCTSGGDTDPICRSNKRWTLGAGYSSDYRGYPL
ncbi:MAG: hypothetical protein ABI969_14400, partial [bacterium]